MEQIAEAPNVKAKHKASLPPFLRPGDVARVLGLSTPWVTILADRGEFRYHRAGGRGWRRIERASVEEYAAKNGIELNWSLLQKN